MAFGGMFNILSIQSGDKIDIWKLADSEFEQSRFARRQTLDLFGLAVMISSPEDTILMKLLWTHLSGGSEKQLFDAARVYELQVDILDQDYLDIWIKKLVLEAEYANMQRFFDLPL